MNFLEYIDIEEQYIDVYVYTKDKRVIVIKDLASDIYIDDYQVAMDHWELNTRTSFVMVREDFSHVKYIIKDRNTATKKDFDDLHSFIEDQINDA